MMREKLCNVGMYGLEMKWSLVGIVVVVGEGRMSKHAELITRAVKWLHNTQKLPVVITEMTTYGEEPDAIGWSGPRSILVECKTSYSDFKADMLKPYRRAASRGMGQKRYYFAPPDLAERIVKSDLKPARWGVVAVHPRKCAILLEASTFPTYASDEEARLLVSALQRVGSSAEKCVSAKLYTTVSPNPRAGIHLEQL